MRELEELGLLDPLLAAGVAPRELVYYTKRGQVIWREARGASAGYRWPQVSIHRGHLQQILLDAVVARLGPQCLMVGHEARSVAVADGGVKLTVRPLGQAGDQALVASVVVGVDGIHSAIRRQLHGDEGPPRWNGSVLWRGTCLADRFLDGRTMVWAGHPDQKFVCYPIEDRPDGRRVDRSTEVARYD